MNGRDWKPITISKSAKAIAADKLRKGEKTIVEKGSATKISKALDGDEIYITPKVPYETTMAIQKARLDKKLTQKELAHLCSLPEPTIKAIENGTMVWNGEIMQKIARQLGFIISKPDK